MRHIRLLGILALGTTTASAGDMDSLVRRATGAPGAARETAVAELRRLGPDGLRALLDAGVPARDAAWSDAVDRVAAQKDAAASGLYWYTDLPAALREARRLGRPVLSLRLLGRLDEEMSCANSRFFRVALYPDERISRILSEGFVLHWHSVRPAPRLTVDYGDGRRLERTVTGNSLHLVLSSDGSVLDVLPGLYAPATFHGLLQRARDLARTVEGAGDPAAVLAAHHARRLQELDAAWARDLRAAGLPRSTALPVVATAGPAPRADLAAPLAVSKMFVERPLVREIVGAGPEEAALWSGLASAYLTAARLGPASRELVGRKAAAEADVDAVVAAFERSLAADTAQNEHLFHRAIHGWLASAERRVDSAAITSRVYDELFLTPDGDPWLGLAPADSFAALPADGRLR